MPTFKKNEPFFYFGINSSSTMSCMGVAHSSYINTIQQPLFSTLS